MSNQTSFFQKDNITSFWNLLKQYFAGKDTATQTSAGLMSAEDKTKLDNLSSAGGEVSSAELNQIIFNEGGCLQFTPSSHQTIEDEQAAYGNMYLFSIDKWSSVIYVEDLSINIPTEQIETFETEIGYIELTNFSLASQLESTSILTDNYEITFKIKVENNQIKLSVLITGNFMYGVSIDSMIINLGQAGSVG